MPLNDVCALVPSGAYLLNVLWSGMHVPGSPFKVSVVSGADASKVVCSGDGLSSGVVNRDSSVLIDARRAGVGLFPTNLITYLYLPMRSIFCFKMYTSLSAVIKFYVNCINRRAARCLRKKYVA